MSVDYEQAKQDGWQVECWRNTYEEWLPAQILMEDDFDNFVIRVKDKHNAVELIVENKWSNHIRNCQNDIDNMTTIEFCDFLQDMANDMAFPINYRQKAWRLLQYLSYLQSIVNQFPQTMDGKVAFPDMIVYDSQNCRERKVTTILPDCFFAVADGESIVRSSKDLSFYSTKEAAQQVNYISKPESSKESSKTFLDFEAFYNQPHQP